MAEARMSLVEESSDREIVISRVFDAPRELVWEAMTDSQHVLHWWGPNGFSTTVEEMDVRPGGTWKHTMHGPDGTDYPNKSVFTAVVKPERLAYSHGGGKKGGPDASFEATWTFEAQGDKTKLTIRMLFPSAAERDHVVKEYGAIEGGKQTLGRLAEYLPKMSSTAVPAAGELVITRLLDAPRRVVFEAWTSPQHLAHWWGPRGFRLPVCELDLRPGGAFRMVMRGPDGKDYPYEGVYLDIVAPERIVCEGTIHDVAGQQVRTTLTFTDQGGKTKVKVHQVYSFESAATRGAPQGWSETLDRLAEFLAKA